MSVSISVHGITSIILGDPRTLNGDDMFWVRTITLIREAPEADTDIAVFGASEAALLTPDELDTSWQTVCDRGAAEARAELTPAQCDEMAAGDPARAGVTDLVSDMLAEMERGNRIMGWRDDDDVLLRARAYLMAQGVGTPYVHTTPREE
jgi:hypothetical protein